MIKSYVLLCIFGILLLNESYICSYSIRGNGLNLPKTAAPLPSFPSQVPLCQKYRKNHGLFSTTSDILIDTKDLVNIFSRMADKSILLDVPGAGTPDVANCCHSGCDSCNFSHIFDNLSSSRAKWVATYVYREFIDGRNHMAQWTKLFGVSPENIQGEAIGVSDFTQRFHDLEYQMSIGTSIDPTDDKISSEALELLWDRICSAIASKADKLTATDFANGLKIITGEEHGAMYSKFSKFSNSI